MKYRATVCAKYYQDMCVEADSQEEATALMVATFNVNKAEVECDVYDMEEVR